MAENSIAHVAPHQAPEYLKCQTLPAEKPSFNERFMTIKLTPEISVIIVAYNSGNLLLECVQNVLAASSAVEVIVADNASSDNSIEALVEFFPNDQRLTVIRNSNNFGFGAAINRAVPMAQAPYILTLNPDCMIGGETIARALCVASSQKEIGVVGCRMIFPDGSTDTNSCRLLPTPMNLLKAWLGIDSGGKTLPDNHSSEIETEAISGAFMLMRKELFMGLGGFDERFFLHWEDLDICARVRQAGYKVLYLPNESVKHIKGTSSKHRARWVEWQKHLGLLKFFHKFHFAHVPMPVLAVLALPLWLRLLVKIARPVDSRQRDL